MKDPDHQQPQCVESGQFTITEIVGAYEGRLRMGQYELHMARSIRIGLMLFCYSSSGKRSNILWFLMARNSFSGCCHDCVLRKLGRVLGIIKMF